MGATIDTSTLSGGTIASKWMLKPCANISVLPGRRCGSIDSLYTSAWMWSGISIMMMSDSAAASSTSPTFSPSPSAFSQLRLPS